jgi:hypothetical protein
VYGLHTGDRSYLDFHTLIFAVLRWVVEQASSGHPPTPDDAGVDFATRWNTANLQEHWFEPTFRQRAEQVVRAFAERVYTNDGRLRIRERVALDIDGRTLMITVDEVEEQPGHTIWRRYHFGHPAASHKSKDHRPALFMAGHTQDGTPTVGEVRLYYPLAGIDETATPSRQVIRNRVEKMKKFIMEIESGHFEPKPSQFRCSICPFMLICLSGGDDE